ncbi:MAG TPA: hypothetical protein VJK25_03450 [Patescibacteria group bacterium]|nr:hypothetical protein [Patescibacteria group bacterium]
MLENFNRTTRIIVAVALAILIWVVGIIIGQEQTVTILNPEGGLRALITRTQTIKTSLMLDWGNGQIKVFSDVSLNYGDSVLQLLSKVNLMENSDLNFNFKRHEDSGELQSYSIGGYASQPGGKQWLTWLNNSLQTKEIDQIRLKANDVVELKYIKLRE